MNGQYFINFRRNGSKFRRGDAFGVGDAHKEKVKPVWRDHAEEKAEEQDRGTEGGLRSVPRDAE